MTAIVGALNKKGIAVAADSAMTMRNGKVINTAQKIFKLESQKGIGIAIYNSASFMGIPINVIITVFDQYCTEKNKVFETIEDCQKDFLIFLEENDHVKNIELSNRSFKIFLINSLKIFNQKESVSEETIHKYALSLQGNEMYQIFESAEVFPDTGFLDSSFQHFISKWFNDKFSISIDDRLIIDLLKGLINDFFINQSLFTGILFFGYGSKSIYPALRESKLFFGTKNFILFNNDEQEQHIISNERGRDAKLCAFAQRDVVDNLVTGLSKQFHEKLTIALGIAYKKIALGISTNFEININNPKLREIISNNRKNLLEHIDTIGIDIANTTLRATTYLDIKDLGEYVESLIYVTYLNRRLTSDREGVGGDIDVAVITLQHGFQWKNKKSTL